MSPKGRVEVEKEGRREEGLVRRERKRFAEAGEVDGILQGRAANLLSWEEDLHITSSASGNHRWVLKGCRIRPGSSV